DFNGNTGPFIQYTYARIQSLLTKAGYVSQELQAQTSINSYEKALITELSNFKEVVRKAAESLSPALVANYVYEVVKLYNSFYQNNPVLTAEDDQKSFRLALSYL